MPLVAAALLPHPKSFDSVPKTAAGFEVVKKLFKQKKVELLIVVSPRVLTTSNPYTPGPTDSAAYYVLALDKLQASSPLLKPGQSARVFDNDTAFVREVKERARPFGMRIMLSPTVQLDDPVSSTLTTLYPAGTSAPKIVSAVLPYLAPKVLFEFGRILGGVAEQYKANIAILAVGDLSARLSKDSPAGFDPAGAAFDKLVADAASKNDFLPLIKADAVMLEKSGQEAGRPLAVVAAAVTGRLKSKLNSYEIADGTGHAVLTWS